MYLCVCVCVSNFQDDDAAALQNLEQLMTEFFSPETTNERKRTIERIFQEFSAQIDSWKPCLHFLSSTSNHYVSMFALSTLEVISFINLEVTI